MQKISSFSSQKWSPQTKHTPPTKLLLGSELSRWGDLDFLSDPKSESRRCRPDTAVDGPDVELYLLLFRTSPRVFGIQGPMAKALLQRCGNNPKGIKTFSVRWKSPPKKWSFFLGGYLCWVVCLCLSAIFVVWIHEFSWETFLMPTWQKLLERLMKS